MQSTVVEFWKEAIWEMETNQLGKKKNQTWGLIYWPVYKPIGCKWIFKKKLRPDDAVKKY